MSPLNSTISRHSRHLNSAVPLSTVREAAERLVWPLGSGAFRRRVPVGARGALEEPFAREREDVLQPDVGEHLVRREDGADVQNLVCLLDQSRLQPRL